MEYRQFLKSLEESGDLVRIKDPVAIDYEIGAMCRHLSNTAGPAILLEKVGNSKLPLAANVYGTRARVARALGVSEEDLVKHVSNRLKTRIQPAPFKGKARCQEVVMTGKDINVLEFPFPKWNVGDGGRYSTAGLVIAKHPELGWNLSYHRQQLLGPNTVGVATASDHQLCLTVDEGRARGERVEAAILLGARPSVALAAGSNFPTGDFELTVAGALEQKPIEVVKCLTVDVSVPEDTEIVFEGYFTGEVFDEGPFVEFTGSQTPVRPYPKFTITAITHRRDPICPGVYAGKSPCETNVIWRELEEAEALETLRRRYPILVGLSRPSEIGRDFICFLQIDPSRVREGVVRNLLLSTTFVMPRIKYVIAVDDDVDIYNINDVLWALGTRCDPKADMAVVRDTMTTWCDPSSGGLTAKVFFDATKKQDFRGALPAYPDETKARALDLLAKAMSKKSS